MIERDIFFLSNFHVLRICQKKRKKYRKYRKTFAETQSFLALEFERIRVAGTVFKNATVKRWKN